MAEKIDTGRRKALLHIPLVPIVFGILSDLLPSGLSAADLSYQKYETPSSEYLKKNLDLKTYPEEFEFCYQIPPNRDSRGDQAEGSFRIKRNPGSTLLEMIVTHPKENKLVQLSECRSDSCTIYSEKEVSTQEGIVKYDNQFEYTQEEKPPTIISLVESLTRDRILETSFLFKGASKSLLEYKFNVRSMPHDGFDLVLHSEIEGDSCRVPWVKIFYRNVDEKRIPVEIWAGYEVKISLGFLGSIHDEHTIKAVLKV